MDLVVTTAYAEPQLAILLNEGGLIFSPRVDHPILGGPTSVKAADLDGDGRQDLVVAAGELLAFRNLGAGKFGAPLHFSAGDAVLGLQVGDLSGEGRTDVVATNSGTDMVSVLINTCSPE